MPEDLCVSEEPFKLACGQNPFASHFNEVDARTQELNQAITDERVYTYSDEWMTKLTAAAKDPDEYAKIRAVKMQ